MKKENRERRNESIREDSHGKENPQTMRAWVPDLNADGVDNMDANEVMAGAMMLQRLNKEEREKNHEPGIRWIPAILGILGILGGAALGVLGIAALGALVRMLLV